MPLYITQVCIKRSDGQYVVSYQYSPQGRIHTEEVSSLADALQLIHWLLGDETHYQKGVTDR